MGAHPHPNLPPSRGKDWLTFEADFGQRVLEGVQGVLDVALGGSAHVSDAEDVAREGCLSAGYDDVVVGSELADEGGRVNAVRDGYGGHGVGGVTLVAGEQFQAERFHAVAGEPSDGGVPLEHGAHALGE